MPAVNHKALAQLAACEAAWCVSLYLPTHRAGPDLKDDRVHLKVRTDEADRLLEARGVRSAAERARQLEPARALVNDAPFWRHQSDGLAVFIDDAGRLTEFRVPHRFEDLTIVAPRFHLVPLVAAIENDRRFYVLAASRNGVHLLHGNRERLDEVNLPRLPQGVESLFFDADNTGNLQLHTLSTPGAGGKQQAAVFHGQGGGERPKDERVLNYLRAVDAEVFRAISEAREPLLFAGDVALLHYYRKVNRYPHLEPDPVPGNPEPLHARELHARAWPLVEHKLQAERHAQIDAVHQALGQGKGSTALEDIVLSARDGRVDALLLPAGRAAWGRYDESAGRVHLHPHRTDESEDIANLAALMALRNSGRVLLVDPAELPPTAPAAASYRF